MSSLPTPIVPLLSLRIALGHVHLCKEQRCPRMMVSVP